MQDKTFQNIEIFKISIILVTLCKRRELSIGKAVQMQLPSLNCLAAVNAFLYNINIYRYTVTERDGSTNGKLKDKKMQV